MENVKLENTYFQTTSSHEGWTVETGMSKEVPLLIEVLLVNSWTTEAIVGMNFFQENNVVFNLGNKHLLFKGDYGTRPLHAYCIQGRIK